MKHDRAFKTTCICSGCDGRQTIPVGRRGTNDPGMIEVECPDCCGAGEVDVEHLDDEEDANV